MAARVAVILDALGAPCALIGAAALAAHGYPRATVDVDPGRLARANASVLAVRLAVAVISKPPVVTTPSRWARVLPPVVACGAMLAIGTKEMASPVASLTVKVDENYVRESILEPGAKIAAGYDDVMPPTPLEERDLLGLIAFLQSLKEAP